MGMTVLKSSVGGSAPAVQPPMQQQPIRKIGSMTILPPDMPIAIQQPAPPPAPAPKEPGMFSNPIQDIGTGLAEVRDWLFGAPAPAPVPQTAEQQLQPPPPDQAARRAQLEAQLPIRPDWSPVIADKVKQSLVGKLITGGLDMLPQQEGPQQFGGMGPRPVKPQLENATGIQELVGGGIGFLPDLGPIGAISKGARALGAGRAAAGALGFGYTEAAKGGIDVLRGELPITQLPEHVAKSAVMGGVLGKLGQLPALKGAIAEMGAMAGLPGLMEGRLPTAEEVGAGIVYPLAFRAPGAIRAFLSSRGVPPEIATVAERELLQLEYKPQPIEMPTREQQARDNTARVMDEIARATEAGRLERGTYNRPPEPPESQIQIPTTRFEQPPEVSQVPIPRSESGLRAIPVQPPNREARRARTEAGLEPSVQANNPLDVIGWLAQQFNRTPYAREVKELMPDKKMEEIRFLIRKYNQEKGQPVQTPPPKEPAPTQAALTPEQAVPSPSISTPKEPIAEVPSRDRSEQGREVLGGKQEGQELGRAVQVQGESPEAAPTGRVLQAPKGEIAPTVAEQPAPVIPQAGPERAAQLTELDRERSLALDKLDNLEKALDTGKIPVFHGTSVEAAESISRTGLAPSNAPKILRETYEKNGIPWYKRRVLPIWARDFIEQDVRTRKMTKEEGEGNVSLSLSQKVSNRWANAKGEIESEIESRIRLVKDALAKGIKSSDDLDIYLRSDAAKNIRSAYRKEIQGKGTVLQAELSVTASEAQKIRGLIKQYREALNDAETSEEVRDLDITKSDVYNVIHASPDRVNVKLKSRDNQSDVPANIQKQYDTYRKRMEDPNVTPAVKRVTQGQIDRIEQQYPGVKTPYGKNIATGRTEQQGLLDKINQAYEQTGKLSPQEVDMRVDELVRTGKADTKLKSADQATKRHAVSEPELARIWQEHVEGARKKQGPAKASAVDELVSAVMEMPRRIATAIAKLHNVDWKGSTRAIKDRIVAEIKRLFNEETGAARIPGLGKYRENKESGKLSLSSMDKEYTDRWQKVKAEIDQLNKKAIPVGAKVLHTTPKSIVYEHEGSTYEKTVVGRHRELLREEDRLDNLGVLSAPIKPKVSNLPQYSAHTRSTVDDVITAGKKLKSSGRRVLEGLDSFTDSLRSKKSTGTPADKEARMNKALEETKAIVESGGNRHYTMEEMNNIAFSGVGSKVITDQVLKGRSDKKLLQEAGAVTHLAEVVLGSARQKMLDVIEGRVEWEKGVKQIEDDLNGPIIESMRNLDSDIGRTFRWMQNQVVPRTELELADKMREAILAQKGKLTAAQQKQFKRMLNRDLPLDERLRLAKEIGDPKLKDYILEYTYNNMLSSPATLGTNFLQTTIWLAAQVPLRVVEGGVSATWDAIRKAGTLGGIENNYIRTKYASEAFRLLAGIPAGVAKGKKLAWDVLKTNAPTAMDTRVEQEIMSSIRAFERLAEKHDSKTLKAMAVSLSWASRTMRASDILLKTVAFEGEMRAILHREATNLAKKANVSYSEAMDKVMNRPSAEVQAAMKAAAEKFAHTSTFNDMPIALTRNLIGARGNLGLIGHVGVPFMNTMINYMARSNELMPGVGLAKQAIGASTGGRGVSVIPANELVARQLVGTAMSVTAAMLFSAGLLTGRGSEDSKRRQLQGRTTQPDSLWVGDVNHIGEADYGRWVSIKVLGPLAAPLMMTTRFMEAMEENKKEDGEKLTNDWIEKTAVDVAEAYRDHMVNSTFIKGAMNMLGYSTMPFTFGSVLERTAGGVAGQFVPSGGLVRTLQRTWEAAQSDEGIVKAALNGTGVSAKEVNNWYDPLLSTLPGNSVPKQLDVFGRPVKLPGGLPAQWLPVQYMNPSPDPADKELNRLGQAVDWYPAKPARVIQIKFGRTTIDNYRIPDKIYRDYAFSVGSDFKKWLDKEITLPGYKAASDEGKMEKIQKKLDSIRALKRSAVRELIRKQLISEGKITANGTITVEDL